MPRWIQCPDTGKLIPAEEYHQCREANAPQIMKPIDEFKSPIDGRIIRDRSHLRQHNKEHGVTDLRDYSSAHFERAAKERHEILSGTAKSEVRARKQALVDAMRKLDV